MAHSPRTLLYMDVFLESFRQGNQPVSEAFGYHTHWGYWPAPQLATGTVADFQNAAEALTRKVCQAALLQDGMNVIDAGCGFGGTIASINQHYRRMTLVGLNIDGRQLARARQQVLPVEDNQILFLETDASQSNLEGNSFDALIAIESILHFPSRERFFQEAARLLRPGGRLVLCDFVPTETLKPWIALWEETLGKFFENIYGPHNMRYTLADYHTLGRQTQLQLCSEEDITINTLPSYRLTRELMKSTSRPGAEVAINNSVNQMLEWHSSQGSIRYMILAFERL